MAIAFDSATAGEASATSLTFSHTATGSELCAIVSIFKAGASDDLTGVTYGGTGMTLIRSQIDSTSANWEYLYILLNPATGAQNVVVSLSASHIIDAQCSTYTGAKQSAQPDSSNSGNSGTATSLTVSTTTVANNCWLVGGFRANGTPVAGTNTTNRTTVSSHGAIFGDSNGPQTIGSKSLQETDAGNPNGWIGVVASITPAQQPSSNFLAFI